MSAALLRLQIERSLEHRFPAALSPVPRTLETTPTGIREVDDLLDGGLPTGAITEITGVQSSGRTSLALAFVARQTGEGRSCAWIDADDAFDPESAAASGVLLRQLLWVRCRGAEEAAEKRRGSSEFDGRHPSGAKARADFAARKRGLKPPLPSVESSSAVCEVRTQCIGAGPEGPTDSDLFMARLKSCPGYKTSTNSGFSSAGEDSSFICEVPAGAEAHVHFAAFSARINPCPSKTASDFATCEAPGHKKPWARLEQAIRATDLLLQAGGFAAIVLDIADTAPEHASRIPLATWFRFRQAAARTRCSLVVMGQAACAQSSAAAVLKCAPLAARDKGSTVLDGFTFSLRRSRGDVGFRSAGGAGRKPPESAWLADCAWNAEKRA